MREMNRNAEVFFFHAEWSGSCTLMMSMVRKIMNACAGEVICHEVNVDRHDEVAGRYGISRIPMILFVRNGVVMDSITGIAAEAEIIGKIDRLIDGDGTKPVTK